MNIRVLQQRGILQKDFAVEAAEEKGSRSTLEYGTGTYINYVVIHVP
jgi:hypothetical protein